MALVGEGTVLYLCNHATDLQYIFIPVSFFFVCLFVFNASVFPCYARYQRVNQVR